MSVIEAAHVWGERFIIERDSLLLAKATSAYAKADADGPWHGTKSISVNVAVRSLLSDAYAAVVRDVLADVELDPGMLTLEISEKDPIHPEPNEDWGDPLPYFHRRLVRLAHDLEIGFAVDDFGVGYSSLARLAELPLTQIKVDRAVLHHPLALDELDLVMRVARHNLGQSPHSRAVIIEGFDGESEVTLQHIYEKRILHVQGHAFGETSTSLHMLDDAVRDQIAAMVRGDHDNRSASAAKRNR